MLIEILTFRLRADADEDAFLVADKLVQAELSPAPGFVRRTLARGDGGGWLVLTFWDPAHEIATSDALDPFIDHATIERSRYTSLPG